MKDKVILVEMLIDKIEQYGKTSMELYKLKAIDKTTDVFASLASRIVIFGIIALFFILFTIGIALYLGDVLGKSYYGFFAMGGFYVLVAIILFIIRKPYLEKTFNNYIINQIFKEKENAGN
jgi:phage-related holin